MSPEIVMFTGGVGIKADKVEVLDSDEALIVVKAWFRKAEPVDTLLLPDPDIPPSPEVEDPGPQFAGNLSPEDRRVLVDA